MDVRTDKPGTPQAVEDCHALLLWLIPQLDKFPRNRRFTLGERLESGLLSILEELVAAAYSRNKVELLQSANLRLETVRHLWRLAHELQVIPTWQYEHGATLLLNLGRQLGGWRRTRQEAAP